jgi:hypothetical protein
LAGILRAERSKDKPRKKLSHPIGYESFFLGGKSVFYFGPKNGGLAL